MRGDGIASRSWRRGRGTRSRARGPSAPYSFSERVELLHVVRQRLAPARPVVDHHDLALQARGVERLPAGEVRAGEVERLALALEPLHRTGALGGVRVPGVVLGQLARTTPWPSPRRPWRTRAPSPGAGSPQALHPRSGMP